MKLRDVPAIPTIIVSAAVGIMIGLGVWQLGRAEWKDALIERYALADQATEVRYPTGGDFERYLYRKSEVDCAKVIGMRATGARSLEGRQGWSHVARCEMPSGAETEIALGWTLRPDPVVWNGGVVAGIIGPAGDEGAKLVASNPPLSNLKPLPQPDPKDMPNNHLSYAVQWFLFALTALVIYILAVRSKQKDTA